jgi:hypothetical protein
MIKINASVHSLQHMEVLSTKMITRSEQYKRLDNLIYSLFGLSEDEARLIETQMDML